MVTMSNEPLASLAAMVGESPRQLEPGPWRSIDQRTEDLFAALIGDYDPMHNESQWAEDVGLATPVVLGVHVLSLLPVILREHGLPARHDEVVRWSPVRLGKVRIPTSLPVGRRFRAHGELLEARRDDAGTFVVSTAHRIEIEDLASPFLVIEELVSSFVFDS